LGGGKIVSFEPFPESLRVLEDAAESDPSWFVEPFALGDVDERLDLQTFTGSDWNSLHNPDSDNLAGVGRTLTSTGAVKVDVRRLDGVWSEHVGRAEVVFLKSDTQGHDLSVLAGAGERLRDVAGLLLEASIVPFYEGEPTLCETMLALAEHGFSPTGFFPVSRSKHSLALTTVDVCFVRDQE
jgi:FkbM family methyltransferase